MTVGGISLSIFTIVLMFSLSRGLSIRASATGSDGNILLLSRKGKSVMFSSIKNDELVYLLQLKNIAKDINGNFLISPEVMHVTIVASEEDKYSAPIAIRGVKNIGYDVHRSVKAIEGKLPEEDNEIMVGKTVYIKMGMPEDSLKVDDELTFEKETWTICGKFEADNSMLESEIWSLDTALMTLLKRRSHTFAVIAFGSKQDAEAAMASFPKQDALSRYFKGWIESQYYRDFSRNVQWIVWISFITSMAVLFAAVLISINTMYTSIMNRMREFGTLRVLGFRRRDIIATLIFESVLLTSIGGGVGIAVGLTINGIPIKLANSAFSLLVDNTVILTAITVSIMIGILGAILPAMHIIKTGIISSLNTR
jgi:putative ABC transport system permease protein